MATPRKTKRQRRIERVEYRFTIDAYTPDTLPMARLAEYMTELAKVLGEPKSVHFRKLEPGSTVLVHQIEREAVPKVRERATAVRRGDGPSEATRAFRTLNRLLRDDDAIGVLRDDKARPAVILRFPGREEVEEKFVSVRQSGSIDGEVIWVGGADQTAHVTLVSEGQQISGCYTTRAIAKELARKIYEPVRLFGKGRWNRDGEGAWTLIDFKIESFEELKSTALSDVLSELRAIPTEWDDESFDELGTLRNGPVGKRNGRH
jgi:hypothetical protein